mgnify:CR=1 FL=1
MTKICIPSTSHPIPPEVELIEYDRGEYKELLDKAHNTVFFDYDIKKIPSHIPVEQLILSYHNFENTPHDLEALLQLLKRKGRAKFYKIATFATSTLDALRMLLFVQKHPEVIGLCMGPLGSITRILAPIFAVPLAYAPLAPEEKSAPGQLLLSELQEIYHFTKLRKQTPIYGLIGNPISQSPGHLYHNKLFQGGAKGVYVKMELKE